MYSPFDPKPHRKPSLAYKFPEITIYSSSIFERIDSDTQFLAQVRSAGSESADTRSLSTDERTRKYLSSYLDLYFERARHACTAYLADDTQQVSLKADNASTVWDKKTIRLRMPHDWAESSLQELALAISQFIVSGIEYEFLNLAYGSASDPLVAQRYDAVLQNERAIHAALSLRTPAQRPVGFPAWL